MLTAGEHQDAPAVLSLAEAGQQGSSFDFHQESDRLQLRDLL